MERDELKYNELIKKRQKWIKIIHTLELVCYALETPVAISGILIPPLSVIALPLSTGTTLIHLALRSINGKWSKDCIRYTSRAVDAESTTELLLDSLHTAVTDGIITDDEYQNVYRHYQRYIKRKYNTFK